MAQQIKQGSIFGRVGQSFGEGLAAQAPKEMEHYRKVQGLKSLENEAEGLTPRQRFYRGLSTYGTSPEEVRQISEFERQQARGQALIQEGNKIGNKPQTFPGMDKNNPPQPNENKSPSITTREGINATIKPSIPRSTNEKKQAAAQAFNENPQYYDNKIENALLEQNEIDATEQARSSALQAQRKGELDVQNTIKSGLEKNIVELTNNDIPAKTIRNLQSDAINAVKPIDEGGEGLTEEQAIIKYGKKADEIFKSYKDIDAIDNWTLKKSTPSDIRSSFNSIREDFKNRNDLENFAESLVGRNGLSDGKAYYLAYKPSDVKDINNKIVKLKDYSTPTLGPGHKIAKSIVNTILPNKEMEKETLSFAKEIAPLFRKNENASPLAIAEELNARGHDGSIFLNYLRNNQSNLGLYERQAKELQKTPSFLPNLNDMWLFYTLGLDPLVEIE